MPSSKSTNTNSARMESKLHLNTLRLAMLIGATLYLNIINEMNCLNQAEQQAISDQQHHQQQQQPSDQAIYGSGSDYASLIAGAENLLNLGQPVFNNNKRARKMSAFMPMRGRKDGRDFQRQQQQQQQRSATFEGADGNEMLLAGPYREAEGDSSIMRLVGASLNGEPNNWLANGTPAPRQFTNQLRYMLLSGGGSGQHAFVPGPEVFGPMQGGDLMQAKPRRAFHPMRGKKSMPFPSSSSSFETASDEIPADFA